jgi:ubiquinone/menaquinone biosynthesis C-methylase UbiE
MEGEQTMSGDAKNNVAKNHEAQILDQFTKQAESYGRLTSSLAGSVRGGTLPSLTQAGPEDVVLDVCCGPGSIALELAPFVAHVTGLDVTPAMLEQARAAQVKRGVQNVDWREGDVYALPFADASFSLVTSGAAFHHITRPAAAFAEMARVCRPGGRIVIRDVTPLAGKSAEYDRMEILRDPSHVHALAEEELAALGAGQPVGAPELHPSITPHMPLEAVLGTSFPTACTIGELREMFRADALSGEDRLGFSACLAEGELRVAYRQTTAIWRRL